MFAYALCKEVVVVATIDDDDDDEKMMTKIKMLMSIKST